MPVSLWPDSYGSRVSMLWCIVKAMTTSTTGTMADEETLLERASRQYSSWTIGDIVIYPDTPVPLWPDSYGSRVSML